MSIEKSLAAKKPVDWRFKHPAEVYQKSLNHLVMYWWHGQISTEEFYQMEQKLYRHLNNRNTIN